MAAPAIEVQPAAATRLGAVATAAPEATEAALEVLGAGGNAMDAAVAAAWALCVCEPGGSGLGGHTLLLFRPAGGAAAIVEGQSRAPAAASLDTIGKHEQRAGRRATTVPSTPATLGHAQRQFGRLPGARVLQPAIRIAENGFVVTPLFRKQLRWTQAALQECPYSRSVFFPRGHLPDTGTHLVQPALAATLRRLASEGTADFYTGTLGAELLADMRKHRGLIVTEDLAGAAQPIERQPLRGTYRGHEVLAIPNAGGPRLLLALQQLSEFWRAESGASEIWYRAIADAVHAALRNRAPGTVPGERHGETTHLCVADAEGNVVSLTQSVQSLFGAKVAHPDLGFFYNNYLRTCPRCEHPAQLQPGCSPRSNVAPTLLLRDGSPFLAIGAAGSRRILSSILQTISWVIDRGLDLRDAIAAPRIHALASGRIWIEAPAATEPLLRRLAGFRSVAVKPALSFKMGAVQAIQFHEDGSATAAADPRRDGRALSLASGENLL